MNVNPGNAVLFLRSRSKVCRHKARWNAVVGGTSHQKRFRAWIMHQIRLQEFQRVSSNPTVTLVPVGQRICRRRELHAFSFEALTTLIERTKLDMGDAEHADLQNISMSPIVQDMRVLLHRRITNCRRREWSLSPAEKEKRNRNLSGVYIRRRLISERAVQRHQRANVRVLLHS
jgi:hypothetical protein